MGGILASCVNLAPSERCNDFQIARPGGEPGSELWFIPVIVLILVAILAAFAATGLPERAVAAHREPQVSSPPQESLNGRLDSGALEEAGRSER